MALLTNRKNLWNVNRNGIAGFAKNFAQDFLNYSLSKVFDPDSKKVSKNYFDVN